MKLANNDAKQYPKLLKHLRNEFSDVLKKSTILKGLESAGIDYRDAIIYTSYGYDPVVDVRSVLSGGGGQGGWEKIEKWASGVAYGLQIPVSLVKAFDKDEDLTTFSMAGNMRMLDAVLVTLLVAWRRISETGGKTTGEEVAKFAMDFSEKAIGKPQAILNPFL